MSMRSLMVALLPLLLPLAATAEDHGDALMKATSPEGGKIAGTEKTLYQDSIQATKQNIARDTLDVFYRDALDYYHEKRYDEALELLDKIYSVNPAYDDVRSLRETIRRVKSNQEIESSRDTVAEYMHKGNAALESGQNVLAISFWKQALAINPSYGPARKKIQDVNHSLAQKEFEAGYLHYNHGDMEDALDSWSNAIALDPTYKQRGLLLLMSKVEVNVRRGQTTRLASQAYEQYEHNDLPGSLQSYQELLRLDPRHEEARRMSAKIKIQLGQAAFNSARKAASNGLYTQAIKYWQTAFQYGYEVQRSQKGIQEALALLRAAKAPKVAKQPTKASPAKPEANAAGTPATAQAPAPTSTQPADPAAALEHYREGLSAFRSKDLHHAVAELKMAAQLDPSNEHIYIALQRAEQEYNATLQGAAPAP